MMQAMAGAQIRVPGKPTHRGEGVKLSFIAGLATELEVGGAIVTKCGDVTPPRHPGGLDRPAMSSGFKDERELAVEVDVEVVHREAQSPLCADRAKPIIKGSPSPVMGNEISLQITLANASV